MRWKKQSKVVSFRVDSATYKKLKKLARDEGGFTVSEYLRGLIEKIAEHREGQKFFDMGGEDGYKT